MGTPLTTSFQFFRAATQVRSAVSSYTPGSGRLTLNPGGGSAFVAPLAATGQIKVTAIKASTYGQFPETYGEYNCTGISGDTLTGLTLANGADTPWTFGDIVEMRNCADHINNLEDAVNSLPGSATFPASANITADPGNVFLCNASSGSFTVTLPTAPTDGSIAGGMLVTTTGSNTVTVVTGGSDTFWDGTTSKTLALIGQLLIIQYGTTGAMWAPFSVPFQIPAQGSGISITTANGVPTISAAGTGTVTLVSVVAANGFAGTVATATTTPAITLTTAATGMLKGVSGALVAATPNTDFVTPAVTTLASLSLPAAQVTGTIPAAQLPLATTSAFGAVKPDGTTITISAGVISAPGGGGTPGGTNGQIQFDNSGSFGGFTASGDATINTSTGAVTVAKIGGNAVTLGGAFTTSGAFTTTLTVTANTSVTLPTTGTLVNSAVTTLASLALPATQITSGTLPAARLPAPTASTLGGVQSAAAVSHQWINSISTSGVPALSQPAASDISGLAASATTDTTNAANITSGTLSAARLPSLPIAIINLTGSGTAITNTTTQTSLFTGATFRSGQSLTISAATLAAGGAFRINLYGTFSCTATAGLQFQLFLGSTVIAQTQSATTIASATTNGQFFTSVPIVIMFPAAGSSGQSATSGEFLMIEVASSQTLAGLIFTNGTAGTATPITINTTGSLALDIKAQWGAASASNSVQLLACVIEQIP